EARRGAGDVPGLDLRRAGDVADDRRTRRRLTEEGRGPPGVALETRAEGVEEIGARPALETPEAEPLETIERRPAPVARQRREREARGGERVAEAIARGDAGRRRGQPEDGGTAAVERAPADVEVRREREDEPREGGRVLRRLAAAGVDALGQTRLDLDG